LLRDIFQFIQRGMTPDGKIVGELVPTGEIPSFMEEIEVNRLPYTRDKFTAPDWAKPYFAKQKFPKAA